MSAVPVAGSGEIINTSHGFAIELDVNYFNPEEIKVVLTDDMLTISGERYEHTPDGQTLRRSFSRYDVFWQYNINYEIIHCQLAFTRCTIC